ncbi:plasmid recombination protein, partial [Pseudoalteromonas sp. AC40-MNA-CIBAN-0181]|uniref:plasmid recombination protein n=1 Tax=Pseudoalteromonas sp. AC40-MNA-CIBAN-0181 TaxID=3140452 RepID=UPI0033326F38
VKQIIKDRLPEKRRADAVLCIEYLITASPEWEGWGKSQEAEFFKRYSDFFVESHYLFLV